MSRLAVLAETIKLARALGVPPESLEYMGEIPAAEIRALRDAASAALFDDTRPMFLRVAAASKLLPVNLLALVAERVFGATLCARICGLIAPERAVAAALKVSPAFLADVSVELDPRRAREIIARMPADRVIAVGAVLVQRGDYITMGRFVDYLPDPVIKAVVDSMESDEALLHVAFFVESPERLNHLVGLIPIERIKSTILLTGRDHGLWRDALGLMDHASDEWKRRIGDLAMSLDEPVLTGMVEAAQQLGVWDSLLHITACMSEDGQRKVANLPATARPEVLKAIVAATDKNDLWADLLPLVGLMGEPHLAALAEAANELADEMFPRVVAVADAQNLWAPLFALVTKMPERRQRLLAGLIARLDESLIDRLVSAVHQRGLLEPLKTFAALMDGEGRRRLSGAAAKLGFQLA